MRLFALGGVRTIGLAAVTVASICAAAFAQRQDAPAAKPSAAVYIMGKVEDRDAVRAAAYHFLVKSERYRMIAVDAIDNVLRLERNRQMSGSVSDEQIAKIGHDAGADYVCVVAQVSSGDGSVLVTTRMVNVKTAEVAEGQSAMNEMRPGAKIKDIIQEQIYEMLGMTADGRGFIDKRDGKRYKSVKFGGAAWMAENLNYQTDGSFCYDGKDSNCGAYGRLYKWETAENACPAGWHLPSRQEWFDLTAASGGKTAGKKLKTKSGWAWNDKANESGNGTDDYGFSALPGGFRNPDGGFYGAGHITGWWTATVKSSPNGAYYLNMGFNHGDVYDSYGEKGVWRSVRCVMDN